LAIHPPINCEPLKQLVRTVPDFPKPGILFYDITTLLKDKKGFAELIDAMAAHYIGRDIDLVLVIEARGFIFGPALAYRLNAGFVPVRKPRKLPAPTAKVTYDLEYGTDTLEVHVDAIEPGQKGEQRADGGHERLLRRIRQVLHDGRVGDARDGDGGDDRHDEVAGHEPAQPQLDRRRGHGSRSCPGRLRSLRSRNE